ncbi:MAG TPA: alkaline phosphatase family protein, partial [Micromonosporaceae bacterium]
MTGAADGLVRPRYGEASLADVLPGVLAALGVPAGDPLGLAAGPLAGIRVVLVLLVDGLGQQQVRDAAPYAPTLTALAGSGGSDRSGGTSGANGSSQFGGSAGWTARVLTAGFPSTTPTSLASLGTGAAPGRHGLLGFTVNLPGTDRVLNHIDWWDEPDPGRWQPLATQFDRAEAAGVATRVVSRPEFAGSGLTVAAYRGGAYVPAAGVDALAQEMLALAAAAAGPTLVYGYHPELDKAGHWYGLGSEQWRQ